MCFKIHIELKDLKTVAAKLKGRYEKINCFKIFACVESSSRGKQ